MVSAAGSNGPASGGATLALLGTNVPYFDRAAGIGSTSCGDTSWLSLTSALCVSPAGGAGAPPSALAVHLLAGVPSGAVGATAMALFSFDGERAIGSQNHPARRGVSVGLVCLP